MFIGHWAPALLAAPRKDAPSLPILFIAAQLVDWAFFGFLALGVEHMRLIPGFTATNPMDLYHMPYTHSLLASAIWAAAFAFIILAATRNHTAALIGGLVVLSHWLLDLLVHVPDLSLAGGEPRIGLGLWNHPAIEMPLEIAITFGALAYYAHKRRPRTLPLVVLGAILLLLQGINWFGPVESHVTLSTTLLAFFAYGLATLASWWVWRSERAR